MLENSKKTKYFRSYLPFLLLLVPLSTYALSISHLWDLLKSGSTTPKTEKVRQETLQSLKVFETNKVYAAEGNTNIPLKKEIVDEDSLSFEAPEDGTDVDMDIMVHGDNAVYTVQKGDSIYSIASYFGVSVDTIQTFNHMSSKTVHVGDVLEIPSESGVLYTIKKGDTLANIVKKYDVDMDEVTLFNGIQTTDLLAAGDEIFLPGGKETETVKKTTTKKSTPSYKGPSGTYVSDISVKTSGTWAKGDTAHLNTPAAIAKYSSQPKYEGYYLFPTPGAMRTQKMHGNNGVDLANKLGRPVLAAADGTVTVAKTGGYNFGYGNYIKISHPNGTETLYGHLSRVDVRVGQTVSRGEQIGAVGSSGNSTGPHLHFEIHGAYNPFAW
jgi:murein DD-endopeptidase MepM/ murein hydrolase activator NlpD